MHDDRDRRAAHAELRRRLDEARAHANLNQTQLAARAALGRGTVSKTLSPQGDVPSVDTVTKLARVLKLPVGELLDLRRTAAGETGAVTAYGSGPGRPIGQWDAHELEVHPAGPGPTASDAGGVRALPGYVRRAHDTVLADAIAAATQGFSGIVVPVGSSSTGKTRACWQAVQELAKHEWRLWHPFDPTRAEAALEDLHRVGPRTVVWLNEAQHYFGNQKFGEQIAAAVHRLLTDKERGPVLVLGTLWPEYANAYTVLPEAGGDDPYSRVRELLAGHTLSVPDAFDTAALATATVLAEKGDELLADALSRARGAGRITQDLAGAPELLNRYQRSTGPVRALLEAAMDARRLGVGLHLPQAFLTDAALGYLSQDDYDQLTDDWAEQAYAQLAEPVHGKQAPLRRTAPRPSWSPPAPSADAVLSVPPSRGPVFRLADYLEQHGRTTRRPHCPPASFWSAAYTHLTHPDDLYSLAEAAEIRHRLQWAHHLRHRSADHGSSSALAHLATVGEEVGARAGAESLARQAADYEKTGAVVRLGTLREKAGDRAGAEVLYRQAADNGSTIALVRLAMLRAETGDQAGAENLAQQAADHGSTIALYSLAVLRERTGDQAQAEYLARQAANHGNPRALYSLAMLREEAGDQAGAENLARQATEHGSTIALYSLAMGREKAGDRAGAEVLYRHAADYSDGIALYNLAMGRERTGDRAQAESLARQAANHGNSIALYHLAMGREKAGDRAQAESLARQAANHGSIRVLYRRSGEQDLLTRLWPHGLDPDGTPTPPW
ncbi:helix-turn-helix domain-containing protein [Streptomyces sp. NPDC051913]|uniref:helix-turn-helix domain-containing protein n=1 Tax=Streptomyces sp. NPDC051913 TaxID=3365676 RepID=UPI0037D6E1EA